VVGYEVAARLPALVTASRSSRRDLVVAGRSSAAMPSRRSRRQIDDPIPSGLSFAEAAAIPVNYSTAYAG